jgi:hypothetical protein
VGYNDRYMTITTHIHRELRLRLIGAIDVSRYLRRGREQVCLLPVNRFKSTNVGARVRLTISELGATRGQVTRLGTDQNDVMALYCGGARLDLRPSFDFAALCCSYIS